MLLATINSSIILIALDIFRRIHLDPLTPANTNYLLRTTTCLLVGCAQARPCRRRAPHPEVTRAGDDPPPYDDTHSSVPTSVEAQDRFLDLLAATVCETAVDANASEPSFLQYAKRTDVVRGRSSVQWAFGGLGKKNP
jgi:hypothetical protein